VGVTDQVADVDWAAAEIDSEEVAPVPPGADTVPEAELAPTKSTRTRPNALDLARAFD
jgi:hypothetical protein